MKHIETRLDAAIRNLQHLKQMIGRDDVPELHKEWSMVMAEVISGTTYISEELELDVDDYLL